MIKLVIANRNYSSWSLRAWVFLTESKVPFEEIRIPLFTKTWSQEIASYSPTLRVPVLLDDDITVWDTMAIIEYLLEKHPHSVGWPESLPMRTYARSISAEMHSGFLALRDELPQNIRARNKLEPGQFSDACQTQIARIDEIWTDCRKRYGESGRWLFGDFSIADIIFIPVALRFVTYSIPLGTRAKEFVDAVLDLESVQQWIEAAGKESESISFIDKLIPAESSPITLG